MALTLDGDNGISGINGSATTPAVQGTDTNTGLTFGTDTVGVVTDGATRTTVDGSGRLLVGETSSTQAGSIDAKAQVVSSDFNAALTVRRNQASDGAPGMLFCKSRGTSNSANVRVNSGDGLGNIRFFGADATGGNDFAEAAAISCVVDGSTGSDDMPGRLEFKTTADGASSPTERMTINKNGFVNIGGHTLPSSTPGMQIKGNGNLIFCVRGDTGEVLSFHANTSTKVGNIVANASSTTYNTSSDYRLKENVVNLDGAIDRVKQLAPKRFNFIADAETTVDGFLAHEAQVVVPEAVTGTHNEVDDDGNPVMQGIDQSKLVPLLTAALQEAIGKIEALETRVAQLEGGAA